MMGAKVIKIGLILGLLSLLPSTVYSQTNGEVKPIQFSGVVTGEDSGDHGLIGVHIFVPSRGRGTTTNQYGFFSMPLLPGDTVMFSYIGYKRKSFVIPVTEKDRFKKLITLEVDTTYLPTLEFGPYLTEELFKQAVLSARLPGEEDYIRANQNLNQQLLMQMYRGLPMDGSENYGFYQDVYQQDLNRTTSPNMYAPIFSPFAWSRFIRSLKDD